MLFYFPNSNSICPSLCLWLFPNLALQGAEQSDHPQKVDIDKLIENGGIP